VRNAALTRALKLMQTLKSGRFTLERLAVKFDVCERTITRDIEALSAAGVPVCSYPETPDPDMETVYWCTAR